MTDKVFYSISEVCKELKLKPHNLRNWENSIPFIQPRKNKFGHRIYTKDDIKKLKYIKELLFEEKYSLQGAVEFYMKHGMKKNSFYKSNNFNSLWNDIKKDINFLKNIIDNK